LLSQPVAEAIEEAAISVAGQTFTKFRTAMSPVKLEQVTVVRMFIRRKGCSRSTFDGMVSRSKETACRKRKGSQRSESGIRYQYQYQSVAKAKLVLMPSPDDWASDSHTPLLRSINSNALMHDSLLIKTLANFVQCGQGDEGIDFCVLMFLYL
jgi:hypothetical protein